MGNDDVSFDVSYKALKQSGSWFCLSKVLEDLHARAEAREQASKHLLIPVELQADALEQASDLRTRKMLFIPQVLERTVLEHLGDD